MNRGDAEQATSGFKSHVPRPLQSLGSNQECCKLPSNMLKSQTTPQKFKTLEYTLSPKIQLAYDKKLTLIS